MSCGDLCPRHWHWRGSDQNQSLWNNCVCVCCFLTVGVCVSFMGEECPLCACVPFMEAECPVCARVCVLHGCSDLW